MNKKILLIISMFLTLSLVTIFFFNNMDNKDKNIISNVEKDKQVINSNMITMMYETDAGTGIYEETKDNTWPELGYIFNDMLSGCENGGELEYNPENNTVNLLSNKSDRCYVYFDKYDGVWIDNIVATNVTGSSVTLSVSATSENGSITKYYYSLNDSEEYQEVTSNIITINDLNKLTEYEISIYAIDSTNAKSNIYEVSVSTTDESGPVINSVEVSDVNYNSITFTVNTDNTTEIKRYYFSIDDGSNYSLSNINSYTFTGLKANTSYKVRIYIVDNDRNESEEYIFNQSTASMPSLANYIKSLYNGQGSNGLYYHDSDLENGAADNSYRYYGANPNNYVCFGSDISPCPNENLYRIIGVFGNEVKIIKNNSIGSYAWDNNKSATWGTSDLKNTLNTTYLNSLSSTWQNKISYHYWKIGGMAYSTTNTAKQFYDVEVGNSSSSSTVYAKIGLMYVSDYGFAASQEYWASAVYKYSSARNSNWLFFGEEWTISRATDHSYIVFYIKSSGSITSNWPFDDLDKTYDHNVRPSFYLGESAIYIGGNGSIDNPFILEI